MINTITAICIIIFFVLFIIGLVLLIYFLIKNRYRDKVDNLQNELNVTRGKLANSTAVSLSFKECNEIIEYITDDIWKNKYYISYRLRDVSIISQMDNEIAEFVKEVIGSISNNVMSECLKYYSYDYLIKKITRTGQMLFIEYTNTHKPNTK